ncbi:glucose-1-phosphate adenylyltransferase [Nitrosomonas sp.]|uniref:glucose-1-phosphate adenylyltransferase n=1 Tax=Nitrosomonas sp. TaxID=42353 RepID=UPI00272EEE0D|nr:glucose-1-phosphate adenylyltransferase [Nitrosomonas sp.]MDP2223646.1 glucose-1-phosphate adenylyltransferase [Nitrosomonas sp.]
MIDTTAATVRFRNGSHPRHRHDEPQIASALARTYAMVLAGGRGSRLMQLTDWRAKPAVPFGGKHRIIDFALSNCVNSGIRRIGVATQYKAHSLIKHLQRGWGFLDAGVGEFLEVLPAQQRVDGAWYMGTANAVLQNIDIIHAHAPEHIIVLAGDHIYKMDYATMLAEHLERDADLSIAALRVPIESASAFGIVTAAHDARITGFVEKPPEPAPCADDSSVAFASMGVYCFDTEFLFELLRSDARSEDSLHDFGHDVIPAALARSTRVFAHRFETSCIRRSGAGVYWRDVGTIDAFWAANLDLTRVQPELDVYDESWSIRTLQEQLPPAKFILGSPDGASQTANALVSSGCIISGAAVRNSLLFTDVWAEQGTIIEDSVVLPRVRIGHNVRLRRAVVDKYCSLPDGFEAGLDPEADRLRFEVSEGGVVLITPEMLGQRVHEL